MQMEYIEHDAYPLYQLDPKKLLAYLRYAFRVKLYLSLELINCAHESLLQLKVADTSRDHNQRRCSGLDLARRPRITLIASPNNLSGFITA
jgi:hypothetical protein